VIKKEAEKFLKYRDRTMETAHEERKNKSNTSNKWAIGTHKRSLRKYLYKKKKTPGNHEIKNVRNTAILDTLHILWV
jgi:hypothetical protein